MLPQSSEAAFSGGPASVSGGGSDPVPPDWVRRIQWRARRGLLENDLLLTRFFTRKGDFFTRDDHDGLAEILELTDNDLLDLLVGRRPAHELLSSPQAQRVLNEIRAA
ncbi:MAG: succinate dehydrogenase assembly factor 2 [Betaproteobacteria bacterium]|nr:succinate dehydrogenase assembly factor 2 [Betaproteobacteria bacterium]